MNTKKTLCSQSKLSFSTKGRRISKKYWTSKSRLYNIVICLVNMTFILRENNALLKISPLFCPVSDLKSNLTTSHLCHVLYILNVTFISIFIFMFKCAFKDFIDLQCKQQKGNFRNFLPVEILWFFLINLWT